MSAQVELRVGMSLFWAHVAKAPPGHRVTWRQFGRDREVWAAGDVSKALAAARELARSIDSQMATVRA